MSRAPENRATPGKSHRRWLYDLCLLLAMACVALATWHWVSPRTSPINYLLTSEPLPAVPHARRPETLDPARFSGPAADAYRVARERPGLLERLPCYCGCYLTAGHQNSLDCFRDHHAETCQMCVQIALQGEELARQGYQAEDIKAIIDRRFARRKPLLE